ncbi:MAG: ribosome-associated translation inhibitor RaiA [Acidobacteria bacterium]|nr:ribosome-associated translation inhibitor RaiA [Acidobacteriota bacterium]
MRVELTGHQIEVSPGLRSLVDRKLVKVTRVLNDAGVSAAVVVKREKVNNVVEITLHLRSEQFMHAVGKADTWQAAMTLAVAKLLHQAEKVKGKWQERKRRGVAARSVKAPRRAPSRTAPQAAPEMEPPAAKRPRSAGKRGGQR